MKRVSRFILANFDELWGMFVDSNDVDPDFIQHVYDKFEDVEEFIKSWPSPILNSTDSLKPDTSFIRTSFKTCMKHYWSYAHPQPPRQGDLWYDGEVLRVAQDSPDGGSEWTEIGYMTDEGFSRVD